MEDVRQGHLTEIQVQDKNPLRRLITVFVNWSPEKRQEIALAYMTGQLPLDTARALLNGYYWSFVRPQSDDESLTRYQFGCELLGIPFVTILPPTRSAKDSCREVSFVVEHVGDLTTTAVQHLKATAKELGAAEVEIGPDGGHAVFPESGEAWDFLRELLHVLSSTVFRKAG